MFEKTKTIYERLDTAVAERFTGGEILWVGEREKTGSGA